MKIGIENINKCIIPGTYVSLKTDEENIEINAEGDFYSLTALCGVFICDTLTDLAINEPDKFDTAENITKRIIERAINKAKATRNEVIENGKY